MNLFRSEEHVRAWAQFNDDNVQGIITLQDLVKLFSCELFRKRLEPDYLSRRSEFIGEFWRILSEIAETRPFWSPPKQ